MHTYSMHNDIAIKVFGSKTVVSTSIRKPSFPKSTFHLLLQRICVASFAKPTFQVPLRSTSIASFANRLRQVTRGNANQASDAPKMPKSSLVRGFLVSQRYRPEGKKNASWRHFTRTSSLKTLVKFRPNG